MSIDARLIGTWWIWKKNDREEYSMYRGDTGPHHSGAIANDAITFWTLNTNDSVKTFDFKDSEFLDLSEIHFPPIEYLDPGVTEIEILPNGNYLIYNTISFDDYGKQENLSSSSNGN